MLTEHGWKIAPSIYYAARFRPASARAVRDEQLKAEITWVWRENFGVYGAEKVWLELNRQGVTVARCTVARLMRELGLQGARRGRKVRTTIRGKDGHRAGDLLNRDFTAPAPNRRWVADFTYVATWAGIVYVAFVVDIYSRAIVGWSAASHKRAKLVLDALQMALWRRDRSGHPAGPGLIHHSDAGSQYTSFRFTAHLIESGIDASIGTVGDAYDNALMEIGDRPVQDRADQTARALEDPRRGRAGHRRIHRLVQHQEASRRHRAHPASRARSQLLRSNPTPAPSRSQQLKRPRNPARFIWRHTRRRLRDAGASLTWSDGWWQVLSSNQRRLSRRSGEGSGSSDVAADDEGLDRFGALEGVDRLDVCQMPDDVEVEQDAVAAEHVAGVG